MGGYALTSTTCIVIKSGDEILHIAELSTELLQMQIHSMVSEFRPRAIKVGWLRNAETVRMVRNEILGCPHIILSPGILSSRGDSLVNANVVDAIKEYLIPEADLLMLRCDEAELLLDRCISTDEDMLCSAQEFTEMGAKAVLLRGGKVFEGRLTALLYHPSAPDGKKVHFFSSHNVNGWQQHGVGGALSAAIATRMGLGDELQVAIENAHQYIHSRIVYSTAEGRHHCARPAELYDAFLNLLSAHYRKAHDVTFYAGKLSIGPRYLSYITDNVTGKSPKQLIAEYILEAAKRELAGTKSSIKEISCLLGFSSVSVFCKFFRQYSGITPTEFRLSDETLSISEKSLL